MELTDAEIYEKHSDELIRFATGLVGANDAADVLSTAVLNAMSSPKWSGVRNKRAYLYRSVVNAANSMGRSSQRRKLREVKATAGTSTVLAPAEVDPTILNAVNELSVQQRAVIFLTYWSDLTAPNVAELLDLSEGTVKRHLARARANLRESLS